MSMSFLNELRYSLENEDVLNNEPVTVEEEAEADVAAAEVEVVRQEVENNIEHVERAAAVVDELEGTNEALAGAVAQSEDGTLDPTVAGMVEAQRRTAAVALNLNPEEGAGAELVDNAGLEGLVKGTISVEEAVKDNKTMIERIKKVIDKIREGVKVALGKIKLFFEKLFGILPRQIKEYAAKLEAMDNATIDARLKELPEDVLKSVGTPTKALEVFKFASNLINAMKKGDIEKQTAENGKTYVIGTKKFEVVDVARGEIKETTIDTKAITAADLSNIFASALKQIDVVKDLDGIIFNGLTYIGGKEWQILGFDVKNPSIEETNSVRAFALVVGRVNKFYANANSAFLTSLRNAVKIAKAVTAEKKEDKAE